MTESKTPIELSIRDVTGDFVFSPWPFNSFVHPRKTEIKIRYDGKDLHYLSTNWKLNSQKKFFVKYCAIHDNKKYLLTLYIKYADYVSMKSLCYSFRFEECSCSNFGDCGVNMNFNRLKHRAIVELQLNPYPVFDKTNYPEETVYPKKDTVLKDVTKSQPQELEKDEIVLQKTAINDDGCYPNYCYPGVKIPNSSDTETDGDSDTETDDDGSMQVGNVNKKLKTITTTPPITQDPPLINSEKLEIKPLHERKTGVCSIVGCLNKAYSAKSRHCSLISHMKAIKYFRNRKSKIFVKSQVIKAQDTQPILLSKEESFMEVKKMMNESFWQVIKMNDDNKPTEHR